MFRKEKVVCSLTLLLYDFYLVYPVRITLSNVDTLVYLGDFYPDWRILYCLETFTQIEDFHLVQMLLSSIDTFIQYRYFFPVWRLLSTAETFTQCGGFYPI